MTQHTWFPGAKVVNLSGSRGNGPFADLRGVILHVNVDEHGTTDDFWRNNAGQVTPTVEVYKDGSVHEMLPLNWQPWCQIDGNFNYAAIETAGLPSEPLTTQQCETISRILRMYHDEHNVPLALANQPGQRGLGTHKMGGASWGGHDCPGDIRTAQRAHLLALAKGEPSPGRTIDHVVKLELAWPTWMPSGHYFGPITGPAHSHGGFYPREQPAIKAIQRRLQALHYAPRYSGWADGKYEAATKNAVAAFQHHYHFPEHGIGYVGPKTWIKLFTY